MLLFLYGDDNFRLKQKLKSIKDKYLAQSATDTTFSVFNSEEGADFEKIKNDIEIIPFLTDKRLIILENFLQSKSQKLKDSLKGYLDKVPETTILVFVEEKMPDQRTALFKNLKKNAGKSWLFNELKTYELEKWIGEEVTKSGGRIDQNALKLLASYVGSNLWQMHNEIEKLILYKYNKEITSADIKLLVKAKLDDNIFNMIDALGYKDIKKATEKLEDLLEGGEPEVYILTMIIYQFRNILIVKDLLERGEKQAEIGQKARMHPFVLQKTLVQAKNFSLPRLKEIYQKLLDTDIALKTGRSEPKITLNLLLVELAK